MEGWGGLEWGLCPVLASSTESRRLSGTVSPGILGHFGRPGRVTRDDVQRGNYGWDELQVEIRYTAGRQRKSPEFHVCQQRASGPSWALLVGK